MRLNLVVIGVVVCFGAGLSGCGVGSSSKTTTTSTPAPTVTSIAISPENSAVIVGNALQFKATATLSDNSQKDITSTATWITSDTTIATVNPAGSVTGVSIGVITIKARSGTVDASTLLNVTQKSFSNSSLKGAYVFTITNVAGTQGLELEVGSINADGNGSVSGVEDLNAAGATQQSLSLSGTYSLLPDGRGTLTLNTSGLPSRTFHFVLSANASAPADNDGYLAQFDTSGSASGILKKQDETTFNNASLGSNTYVFRTGGLNATQNGESTVGAFTTDAAGAAIVGGMEDTNNNGTINGGASTPISITGGAISSVDANTGRATVTLTAGSNSSLVFYVVSAERIEILGLDSTPTSGGAEKQISPAPTSVATGGYAFTTEVGGTKGQVWMVGQFQVAATAVTGLAQYQVGSGLLNFATPPGTTTVAANGRGALQENTTQGTRAFTLYIVSPERMYLLETDDAQAACGVGDLQEPGNFGFGAGTLNNTFIFSAAGGEQTGSGNIALVGQLIADGSGRLTGIEDVSQPQPGNPSQMSTTTVAFTATYVAPGTDGATQGTVSSPGAGMQTLNMYLISPDESVFLGLAPGTLDGLMVVQ